MLGVGFEHMAHIVPSTGELESPPLDHSGIQAM